MKPPQPSDIKKPAADQVPKAIENPKTEATVKPDKIKDKKNSMGALKHEAQAALKTVARYQAPIIMILIGALLAITALRMLSYSNPSASDERVQQNLSSFKKIQIDPKVVNRINQLSDSQTSTGTQVKDGRNNPFSE